MYIKKRLMLLLITVLSCFVGACGDADGDASSPPPLASMRVTVKEGTSDLPIEGARVKVLETGEAYVTDARGSTEVMELPMTPDEQYERLLPSGTGRVTLLVTAEGMTPCLLLYVRVKAGELRGIETLLFPADGTLKVFSMVEAPETGWCEGILDKFGE